MHCHKSMACALWNPMNSNESYQHIFTSLAKYLRSFPWFLEGIIPFFSLESLPQNRWCQLLYPLLRLRSKVQFIKLMEVMLGIQPLMKLSLSQD